MTSVVIGHDGSANNEGFDRRVDVELLYKDLYNKFKQEYPVKSMAEKITLDKILDSGNCLYTMKKKEVNKKKNCICST